MWRHDRSEDGAQKQQLIIYQNILTVVFQQISCGVMTEVQTNLKYTSWWFFRIFWQECSHQLWHHDRSADAAQIHQFSAPNPGVNGCAEPHISSDSLSLNCFSLMFTDELLHIILVQSDHITRSTFKDWKQNMTTGHFCWWPISFSSSDNPDGTHCSGAYKRVLVSQQAMLYSVILRSQDTWSVYACNESDSLCI